MSMLPTNVEVAAYVIVCVSYFFLRRLLNCTGYISLMMNKLKVSCFFLENYIICLGEILRLLEESSKILLDNQ